MGCCLSTGRSRAKGNAQGGEEEHGAGPSTLHTQPPAPPPSPQRVHAAPSPGGPSSELGETVAVAVPSYSIAPGTLGAISFDELLNATEYFKQGNLLGEGGFGPVYKGTLSSTGQVVAVKILSSNNEAQGHREFVNEVNFMSKFEHPHLVKLVGFCDRQPQPLLVYEFMPLGSLHEHLFEVPLGGTALDWGTRMRIAVGVARALEYLHDGHKPSVVFRDMKCGNILLGDGYYPKLSDFGLSRLGPEEGQTHVSTRRMGTEGYCAPEYVLSGRLTVSTDIYSFGVVLLEILSGRVVIDRYKQAEQLTLWAKARWKEENDGFYWRLADPNLKGQYPGMAMRYAIRAAILCVDDDPRKRPVIKKVLRNLETISLIGGELESEPPRTPSPLGSPHVPRTVKSSFQPSVAGAQPQFGQQNRSSFF